MHINALELLAIFYALKAFQSKIHAKHVKVLCDNTTAVNYINNMGSLKSQQCKKIAQIFGTGVLSMIFGLHVQITQAKKIQMLIWAVVQSVVSLTSSLRVISLTVLEDSIYNMLIFFAEKM